MNPQQTMRLTWGMFFLAILAYIFPWTVNTANSLTLRAYDFAEWLSKRPFDDISYITVLLLRGHLLLFTAFICFTIKRPALTKTWWLHFLIGLILVIAQLPAPNAIFDSSDVNRQQQVYLTAVSLLILLIGLTGWLSAYRNIIWIIIALVGLSTTIFATANAINIMRSYQLPAEIGAGAIILSVVYALLGIIAARRLLRHIH